MNNNRSIFSVQTLDEYHHPNHFLSTISSPQLQCFGFRSASHLLPSSSTTQIRRHWSGFNSWRQSPINDNRHWGPTGPSLIPLSLSPPPLSITTSSPSSLSEWGSLVLSTSDPASKSHISHLGFTAYHSQDLPVGIAQAPAYPARPSRPPLVGTREVPKHKDSGLPLNACMLHSLAHVELNAIDLAWDTVVRFSGFREVLGDGFFEDFARVADDESRHFLWCSQRLEELGFSYGDFPAHNLLWKECERTSVDVAARLAVIPLVQEARGLDAGPRLVQRLMGFGDHRTADIVAKIAEEEVAHVAVGVFWFTSVCEKMGWTPCIAFKGLLKEFNVEPKGPFNYSSRDEAGLPRDWYEYDGPPLPEGNTDLSEVHYRLASIIAMEKENSRLAS